MATIQKYRKADGSAGYTAIVRVKPFSPSRQAFTSRADAEEWARGEETKLKAKREQSSVQKDAPTITLATVVERYLADPETKALSSYGQVAVMLEFWVAKLGNRRMRSIGRVELMTIRDELLQTAPGNYRKTQATLSPGRVNRYLAALSAAWNWAFKCGLTFEPWPKKIKLPEAPAKATTATPDELAQLFEECDRESEHLGTLARFLVGTGARLGDALAVQWRDVDLNRAECSIAGKKTSAAYRVAMLPPGVEACRRAAVVKHVSGRVLWYWRDTSHPRESWDRARERFPAALKGIRMHDLRHICAGLLAAAGASTVQLAAQLGHKTLVMVQRYAHLTPAYRSEAHDKLFRMFDSDKARKP